MRKILSIMLMMSLLLLIVGCKRTAEEDIYGDKQEKEPTEVTVEAPQETESSSEPVRENQDDGEENTDVEAESQDDDVDETVTEEVYENDEATEEVDADSVDIEITATTMDDPAFENAMLEFLDPIYYNLFFGIGNYVEGITEGDMVQFAISYIYQHEYNELKFDTEDFILYVPEKRVEELVYRYFDFNVTGHHSFIEDNLMYEDGFYLMPAVDTGWGETLSIGTVTATGDFSYEVMLVLTSDYDQNEHYAKAGVEIRDDRYVLVSYVKAADAQGAPYIETDGSTSE